MVPIYDRLPLKPVNRRQFDVRFSERTDPARTLYKDYGKHVKIFTDRSMMGDKEEYAIVKEEHTSKKRILPQNTVFSAGQSAITGPFKLESNKRHEIVIITDSLSTIMAAGKKPKTQTIRKMLDHEGPRTTLLWVFSHKGIPGIENADEDKSTTERHSPDDLKK
jgi:hypothetical protein